MTKQLLTRSLLLMLLFFSGSTAYSQTEVCGTVYLELIDSYGDGWNGNEIDVSFTGGDSTYTLATGSSTTIPLQVNYLDTANFVWQAGGSYASECSYKITDDAGTVLYTSPSGSVMTAGATQYTAYCATVQVPQVCGTVYLELYDSYGDGWNGNDMDVTIGATTSTYGMSTGSFISYTLQIAYQDTADFIWQAGGSYASECSYAVKDGFGTVLYSSPSGSVMTAGTAQYSAQCATLATCVTPTNMAVVTGATNAALSWDAGSPTYLYHLVEYDTTGFAIGTGDTAWVYADTAFLTNLNSSTQYDFYVTTICSLTDSSAASALLGEYTQCAAIATPWSENFDNAPTGSAFNPSLPQCWDFYTSGQNAYWYPYIYNRNYSFYANSGSNFLYAYRSSSATIGGNYADTTMVIMPEIQGLDSATKQLDFYARTTSAGRPGEVMIGLTDAAGTPGSLRMIDTIYAPLTTYSKFTVYLDGATTGDARVALILRHTPGTYDYLCIDDVSITDIPPCPAPLGLTLTSSTKTTGSISWSSSAVAFDIEVGPMGFVQGTGTTYTSSTTSTTATGLTQNTYYDAYVRSNCSVAGDGYSTWEGPFTFKTECGSFTGPYTETFGYSDGTGSTANPDLPDCWSAENFADYLYNYAYVDKYYYYGNQATDSAYIYLRTYYSAFSSQTALGDTNLFMLPSIDGLAMGDMQVLFNARSVSTSAAYLSDFVIGTVDSTGDISTLHVVDTVTVTGTTYADYSLDLTGVPTDASRVVFIAYGGNNTGYTYGYNGGYIDEITVRQAPQCPEVYDVVASATSDTSATMSWGDSSVVDEYVIEWGPSGFTQATGAPMDTVIGTTWSNMNLLPGTTYDVYVLSVCQAMGVNSPWYGPITIDMPCSPISIPFVDGFETAPAYSGNNANPNLPSCWAYDGTGGTSYSMSYGYAFYAYSGSYSLYNYMYLGGNDTNVVSTPMLENLDQGGHMVTFYAKTNSSSYPGKFNVVMTDANGNYETARIIKAIDLQGSTTHQEYQVYLDSNAVQAGDKRVGFMMYSKAASYDYVFLDSVTVDVMPSCISYDHVTSNITSSSADMSWNYTGANCFNIEYGPAGFIQGTGTGALAGTLDTNVTGPYSVSGLNPNTSYDYYLENCCNPGVWEGPFTFNTECTGPLAAGTYSVGATGDFATLDSVLSTLNVCGISGAVTFELQSGSFYASSPVGAINGSSATNTVTFKGSATTNDTINGGIVLEGASYVNLEDLYIRTTSGHTIRLNGTDHINITGNVIEAPQTNSSQSNPIVASASSTSYSSFTGGEEFITISNNTITGGYFSMTFYGNSGAPGAHHDIEVSNNDISGSYYYGLYFYYGLNIEITDNTIGGFTNTFNYAAYTYQVDGCKITGNHVESYYSFYAYYVNTTTAAAFDSEISNNMMSGGYYGLRVYYCNNLDVYHNTAVGSYAGLYDYYNGATVDIRNNIFQGGTYALYDYNSSAVQDYNLYYSTGTSLAYIYNGSFSYPTDLATLIAADTTNNLSSVVGDPIFASASDLHVYGPLANDVGDNTTGITVDIDGDTRPMSGSTVVDMGADEFDVAQDDAALTALLSPTPGICGGDSLMVSVEIGNFGQTTITSMTVSADVLGQTLTVSPTTLSIPFGGKDTIMLGYVSNYVGGPMSVVAYTTLANDSRPGNDTLSTLIDVSDAQQVSVSYPSMLCAGDDAVMTVAHPLTGTALWMIGNDTLALAGVDSTITSSDVSPWTLRLR